MIIYIEDLLIKYVQNFWVLLFSCFSVEDFLFPLESHLLAICSVFIFLILCYHQNSLFPTLVLKIVIVLFTLEETLPTSEALRGSVQYSWMLLIISVSYCMKPKKVFCKFRRALLFAQDLFNCSSMVVLKWYYGNNPHHDWRILPVLSINSSLP